MRIPDPIHIDTITICSHYMPALINGDYSGLSDKDQDDLDQWDKSYRESGITYIYNVRGNNSEYGPETEFARDVVTGLMADCYTVDVFEC